MDLTIAALEQAAARRFSVFNPATGDRIGECADMTEAEALKIADAAGAAFDIWSSKAPAERERIMLRAADLMLEHQEALARIITLEQGKPLSESRDEIVYGAGFVRWYAAEARRVYGDIVPSGVADKHLLVFREPVGSVLVITAGNDPFAMVTRKAAPALAAGCPVIIKPAQDTPFSALAAVRLLQAAGMPADVVTIVTSTKAAPICEALLTHDAVRHVTFTGSSAVGKVLAAQAGKLMKPTTLELGGHAPFVVYDDAPFERAVDDLIGRKFTNAGQTCSCPARIFLHEPVADRFLEAFSAAAARIVVGSGLEADVGMGPMLNKQAVRKVEEHIEDAISKGARLMAGGAVIERSPGTFFPPTILTGVTDDMKVAREETFGPVAAFFRFKSEEDLARQLNHPSYGLAAYIYTNDMGRAFRTAKKVQAGFIGINDRRPQGPEVPMGGVRDSGLGREGGRWGIEEFTSIKLVSVRY
jgi:succinate-semialdehyde dehydrogenase/glutarate-semialdehyde dehydrogenase